MNEKGEATVALSILGALGAGVPIATGVVLTSDNVSETFTFVIAFAVGLISIGTGVGRIYARWKTQIESAIERDKMLADLITRVGRIEQRQIEIMNRFEKGNI